MKDREAPLNGEHAQALIDELRKILASGQNTTMYRFATHLQSTLKADSLELLAALLTVRPELVAAFREEYTLPVDLAHPEQLDQETQSIVALQTAVSQQSPQLFDSRHHDKPKMVRYRLEVGSEHQVSSDEIKEVLVNESGVERSKIGYLEIRQYYTLIDLPVGMPADIFQLLQSVEIRQQRLSIKRVASQRKRKWQQRRNGQNSRPRNQENSKISR